MLKTRSLGCSKNADRTQEIANDMGPLGEIVSELRIGERITRALVIMVDED